MDGPQSNDEVLNRPYFSANHTFKNPLKTRVRDFWFLYYIPTITTLKCIENTLNG